MVLGLLFLLSSLIYPGSNQQPSLYAYTKKRADKVLNKYWEDEEFTLTRINLTKNNLAEIYAVHQGNSNPYAYVLFGEAPSKVDTFIYLVIFNPEGEIEKVSVLVYKENYGGEIGSKRFLNQFAGKYNGIGMDYNKDISGISGATLSGQSITLAIKENSITFSKLIEQL